MEEKEIVMQLEREGFNHLRWEDRPNTNYHDHTHMEETAHIILLGELTLTMGGKTETFCAGDRCDVPAGTVHSAKVGERGCRYLIGER